jgi:hypothetical protein
MYCIVSEGQKTKFKQLTRGSYCEKFEDEPRMYTHVYWDDRSDTSMLLIELLRVTSETAAFGFSPTHLVTKLS